MDFFGATGPDPLKPSLFELVAQEQLRDLLQPALKFVLAVRGSISYLCKTFSSRFRSLHNDTPDI